MPLRFESRMEASGTVFGFRTPEACRVRTLKIGAGTWKRDFQAGWGCGGGAPSEFRASMSPQLMQLIA